MQRLYEGQDRDLTASLQGSCKDFITFLQLKYEEDKHELPRAACILVFDEAQELGDLPPKNGNSEERTYFHHLGSVLKQLIPYKVFSVFLSTNSNLRPLAPPTHLHPSAREASESMRLHPPITELPFDVFAKNLHDNLCSTGESTLSAMCSVDIMVHFGRTM